MQQPISKRRALLKWWRRNVHMREEANRLHHIGKKMEGARKIALVGTTDSGKLAPLDDDTWEIWGVGGRREWMTRANRWYEVHRLAGESEKWVENWQEQARSFDGKTDIFMHYPESGFGERVFAYPVDRIMARFGTYFMTSSFSWMMAAAIDELCPEGGDSVPGEIAIYGIDMEAGAEYLQQRAGLHHFIDLARVMGIRITRLASSGISCEPIPYPMWQDDPLLNKLDKRQVEARDKLVSYDEAKTRTMMMIAQNEAAIAVLNKYAVPVALPAESRKEIERLEKETAALNSTLRTLEDDLILWSGVESEQQWLRDYLAS